MKSACENDFWWGCQCQSVQRINLGVVVPKRWFRLISDTSLCEIDNASAWLYEVARNAVADRLRLKKEQMELPDDLAAGR